MSEPGDLPAGPLLYGQAGVYDAIDDRLLVTTLSVGTVGLVRPPTLTPGAGLFVNIGAWHGVADCEDGTLAVIGSRDTEAIEVPAGGASQRVDVLFADIDPDAGRWRADLYTEAEAATRAGLILGRITVPAGANGSAQFSLQPATVALARVRAVYSTANDQVAGFANRALQPMSGVLRVQAGRQYWFRSSAHAVCNAGANNSSMYWILGGTATVSVFRGHVQWNGPGQQMVKNQGTFNGNQEMNSANMTNGQAYWIEQEGYLVCAGDGTVQIQVAASVAGNQCIVSQGATLLVVDITTGPAGLAAPIEPGEPGRIIR